MGGEPPARTWHRGTACDGGACVEAAADDAMVYVRSSVRPEVSVRLSRVEWQEFLAGVKDGAFDDL